jgi:DNA repair photolyase
MYGAESGPRGYEGNRIGCREVDLNTVEVSREHVLAPCPLEGIEYQIDPYLGCEHDCTYCYAQNSCPVEWGAETGIIPGMDEILERDLSGLSPQTIYVGMNTDPYQPVEEDLGVTRLILERLLRHGHSACMLTKSDLVERDLDLFARMKQGSVGVSLAFGSDEDRRAFEGHTVSNERRLGALAEARLRGIPTYVLICPVVPMVTDVDRLLELAGPVADNVWIYRLEMGSEADPNWRRFRAVVESRYPEREPIIRKAAFDSEHRIWRDLRGHLARLAREGRYNLESRV